MAVPISFSEQPTEMNITGLVPGVAGSTTEDFTVAGLPSLNLACALTQQDLSGSTLTLYHMGDKAGNPSDTIVGDISTTCNNDGSASTITFSVLAGATTDDDIGKTFATDSGQAITITVSYL